MKEKEKERYKVYSYRLNDGTAELFKKICKDSGMSYNRVLYKLLKELDEKNEDIKKE